MCHFQCQFFVFGTVDNGKWNITPGMSWIHFSQFKAGFQQSFDRCVDFLFRNQAFFHSIGDAFEVTATFEICSA